MSAQEPSGSSPVSGSTPSPARSGGSSPAAGAGSPDRPAPVYGPSTGGVPRIPATTGSIPTTGANRIIVDPSRRADVLFRVRRDEDHEVSAWWMIGAFVAVSAAVIVLLSFVPGGS